MVRRRRRDPRRRRGGTRVATAATAARTGARARRSRAEMVGAARKGEPWALTLKPLNDVFIRHLRIFPSAGVIPAPAAALAVTPAVSPAATAAQTPAGRWCRWIRNSANFRNLPFYVVYLSRSRDRERKERKKGGKDNKEKDR